MYVSVTPNMMVKDMNQTLDFYTSILGFEFVTGVIENSQDTVSMREENQLLQWAMVTAGNVTLMFQTEKSLTGEIAQFEGTSIGSSSTLFIKVEDVTALYEELKDKVAIVKDLEPTFYGTQEFYFSDCNGYILGIAGSI